MIGIPYAANGWDEILPGLFMGGHDRAGRPGEYHVKDVIVDREFDLVLSLYRRDGHGPGAGVACRWLTIPDGSLRPEDAVEVGRLADRAVEALDKGERVLVRCQAGYNRSGLVVALTLLRLGYSADEAIALIRERRSPHALHNGHFLEHIESVQVPPRRIQRRRTARWVAPHAAVNVARPGPWGNPFGVNRTTPANWANGFGGIHVRDAAHAVDCYRSLLRESPARVAEIREQLAGKHLMCWCKPGTPCHGDVLLDVAAGGQP